MDHRPISRDDPPPPRTSAGISATLFGYYWQGWEWEIIKVPTVGGNPRACAAGTAALKALTEDGLIENSEKMGKLFREGLEKLKEKHTMIREIRGKGLMIGIEMKFEIRDILMGLIKKGVLMLYSGRNILRILPPLVITEDDVTKVLHALDSILTEEEQKRNVQG